MPPELFDAQYEPAEQGLLAIDVYALAIIMWELWYRIAPFKGIPVRRFTAHVVAGKRLPLIDVDGIEPMPKLLKELIESCWAQDVSHRPDAVGVVRAFEAAFPRASGGRVPEGTANTIGAVTDFRPKTTLRRPKPVTRKPATKNGKPVTERGKRMGEGECLTSGNDAQAESTDPPMATIGRRAQSVVAFLEGIGLEKFRSAFLEYGFTDLDMLGDTDTLDDETLLKVIGLRRKELLTFRAGLAAFQDKNPTVMPTRTKARLQEARQRAGKPEPTVSPFDTEHEDVLL
jgi:hypothetical protein